MKQEREACEKQREPRRGFLERHDPLINLIGIVCVGIAMVVILKNDLKDLRDELKADILASEARKVQAIANMGAVLKADIAASEARKIQAITNMGAVLKADIAASEARRIQATAASEARRTQAIAASEARRTQAIAASEARRTQAIAASEARRIQAIAASEARRIQAIAASEARMIQTLANIKVDLKDDLGGKIDSSSAQLDPSSTHIQKLQQTVPANWGFTVPAVVHDHMDPEILYHPGWTSSGKDVQGSTPVGRAGPMALAFAVTTVAQDGHGPEDLELPAPAASAKGIQNSNAAAQATGGIGRFQPR